MPMIKKNSAVAAILGPDSPGVGDREDMGKDSDLLMISQELIEAVHARNANAVKDCLRAACQCCDSEPHEEGPHVDEE